MRIGSEFRFGSNAKEVTVRLSLSDFVTAGLSACGLFTQWQNHLVYSLQNGYPLSEWVIAFDRNRAETSRDWQPWQLQTVPTARLCRNS